MSRIRQTVGFTLVEVLITIAVLSIVSLGAIGYQFHAVRQAKIGQAKMDAARLGTLLLESWKSQGGITSYDPTTLNLGIARLENSDKYKVIVSEVPYYIGLASDILDTNETTGVTLRQLSVFVQWNSDFSEQTPDDTSPNTAFYTYVRQDQSGG